MKNRTFHIINSSLTDLLNVMYNQTRTNFFATLALSVFSILFTACGDETTENITQINQTDIEVVSSTKELPKCTKDNVGQQAFVKGESSTLICVDNKWVATTSSGKDTVIVKEASNCTTKELKDKSGVKIVCNGDSVGVVLNGKNGTKGDKGDTGAAGKDGTNGKNGAGCTVVTLADNSGLKVVCGGDSVGVVLNGEKGETGDKGDKGDPGAAGKDGTNGKNGTNGAGCSIAQDTKKITITCGDKSSTINLSDIGSSITPDTTVVDSEKVAVSLDSLTGYTQKGPFIKGSTVYLYELMDGRTLKQTNGSFTSNITRDDGRFKFTARDLVSQYVMLVVDGNYRNEVTGKTSNSAIRLKAYSDVRRHATGTVNVNILTHLEFDRVYYLVTREKMTMKKAKQQAQEEIRKQFYIELSDKTDAEDLDVFGTSEADAALLAISILLQGDRSEPEMMALLTEISNDMAEDGKWNGASADSVKAEIALWAMVNHGRISTYKSNVKNWGLGDVPPFEKYIEAFMLKALGFEDDCTQKDEGKKVVVKNKYSPYNGKTYVCSNGVYAEIRTEKNHFNSTITYGQFVDPRDHRVYKTVDIGKQTWMAENLEYADTIVYPELRTKMKCYNDSCEKYGRLYHWSVAFDSAKVFSSGVKECNPEYNGFTYRNGHQCRYAYPVQGLCPEGWHVPDGNDWRVFILNFSSSGEMVSREFGGTDKYGFSVIPMGYWYGYAYSSGYINFWHIPTAQPGSSGTKFYFFKDEEIDKSSFEHGSSSFDNNFGPLRCMKTKDIDYGLYKDPRDGIEYKTVEINGKIWMAENLKYNTDSLDGEATNFCLANKNENCEKYGRYYEASVLQTACPRGWHIPDSMEWMEVFKAHGYSAGAMFAKGYSHAEWMTNTLGLGLIPGMGSYQEYMDSFTNEFAYVWSSYEQENSSPKTQTLYVNNISDYSSDTFFTGGSGAYPIRCIQD